MTQLLIIIVNNIIPILTVAGIGYGAGRRFKIDPKPLSLLIFNVFSPALVFHSLSTTQVSGRELGLIIGLTTLFQLVMASIAYTSLRFTKISRIQRSGIMLSSFSLNAGNYGLSLVKFAFTPEVLARAVIIYVANIMLNNTLGVYVASSGSKPPKEAFLSILRVPAVYATLAAFGVNWFHITLPMPLLRSIEILADAAIPSMLILLGLQMVYSNGITNVRIVVISAGLKLLVAPVVAVALTLMFDMQGAAAAAMILQASMPTAVITLILASEFKLDESLVLNNILVSTLLSPLTLSVVILLLYLYIPGISN